MCSVTEGFVKTAVLFVEVMFPDPLALLHAAHQNRRTAIPVRYDFVT
jgi:hypothetical protein